MTKNKSKHIAFFVPSLRGGGAEKMMIHLANSFADRGLQVDLIMAEDSGVYEIPENVNKVCFGVSKLKYSLFPLIKYLKKNKPDVLIATMEHTSIIAVLANFLARSRTKVIARVANTLSLSLQGTPLRRRLIRKYGAMIFYRFANEIVANSKGSADDLSKTLRIKRNRVKVIYNPTVTPDIFEKAEEEVNHKWLKNKKSPVLLAVGRLHRQKDFPTLIKAFNKLKKEAKLIILGEGEKRKELEKLIKELNLEDSVDMPGFVDNPYAYMAKADVYVLSSQWEGLPNTLIEAMACETPVVSTDCPSGPAEILSANHKSQITNYKQITNPKTQNTNIRYKVVSTPYGKLVPVGNKEAMARAIEKTLENSIDKEILQERGKYFSVERAADEYLNLI